MTRQSEVRISLPGTGKDIACRTDQPLLDAFLRSGTWLPNSCNQGTCGTCKVRVHSGEVDHRQSPEKTLSTAERSAGLALACQAVPLRDTVVEPIAAPAEQEVPHLLRDFTGEVLEVSDIARETRRIRIGVDASFEFQAGQYVEFAVPGSAVGRQYSLANPPGSRELEFHIRREPGGLATDGWIFKDLAIGDAVGLKGPLGDFCYQPDEDVDGIVLLGAGTGLAPLKSIALCALNAERPKEVHLYHGVRTRQDLYDQDFFAELQAQFGNFTYTPCLSRETWSGRSGYVTDALLEDFRSCRNYSGYVCGPPRMVEAGVKALKRRRMPPRRIRREKFTAADHSATG